MRRMILVMATGLLLVGAGVAVAHGFESKAVKEVSATFAAQTVSNLRTATCTGTDASYAKSRGTYTGLVTSTEASLNGPTTIEATSYVNTTTGVGTVSGAIRIDATGGRFLANFEGVLSGGTVVGLAIGGIRHDRDEAGTKLVANLSAAYTAALGFSSGKLGGDTTAGDAVLISRGGCTAVKASKSEKVKARGAITAVLPVSPAPPAAPVLPTSITVAGVTCTVPANLQASVAKLKVTDVVTIECVVANGANTLTDVSGNGNNDNHGDNKH